MRPFSPAVTTYGAIGLATFLWGAGYVMFKVIVTELGPFVGSSSRFVLATVLMLALFVASHGLKLPARQDIRLLALMGIMGPVASSSFLLAGLLFVTATEGTLILAISPLVVALMAHYLLGEPLTPRKVIGAAISLPGVGLILFGGGAVTLDAENRLLGLALLLASAVAWALYMLISRVAVRDYSPLAATAYAFVFGTLVLVPIALPFDPVARLGQMSGFGWIALALGSTLGGALPFVLWNRGVQAIGASRTAIFNNVIPVWTAVISAILLGDRLSLWQWLGAVLVLGGMALATSDRSPVTRPSRIGPGARRALGVLAGRQVSRPE